MVNLAPDKWPEDEVRLVEEVGAWIGQWVLGPVATRIVDYGTPVTVRVIVPPKASGLLYRPLELAYRYESGRFQGFVWHKAPDEGSDIEGALLNLARNNIRDGCYW